MMSYTTARYFLCTSILVFNSCAYGAAAVAEPVHNTVAFKLHCQSRYKEAIKAYEDGNVATQGSIEDNMNYAQALWSQKKYKEGKPYFNARLRDTKLYPALKKPFDIDEKFPRGTRILVRSEKKIGIGDDLTFGKKGMLNLQIRGAYVILKVEKPFLAPIMDRCAVAGLFLANKVTTEEPDENDYDHDIYVMSTNWNTEYTDENGKQVEEPLHIGRCIHPLAEKVAEWRDRFSKFGVATQAKVFPVLGCHRSGELPVLAGRKLERSIALRYLARIAEIDGVALFNTLGNKEGHSPITTEEYATKKANGTLGKLDDLDVLPEGYKVLPFNGGYQKGTPGIYVFDKDFDEQPFEDYFACGVVVDELGGIILSSDTVNPNGGGALAVRTLMLLGTSYKPVDKTAMPLVPADARWGDTPEVVDGKCPVTKNPFFESVTNIWQAEPGEWEPVIETVKELITGELAKP